MTSAPSHPPPSSGSELTPAPAGAADALPSDERGAASTAPHACLNCGAPVGARFCPSCGQRVADPDPTLREMAEELAGELLHWDGKLLATLKSLVVSPGA